MAGKWFEGLGQTIAGGIATVATLGLNDDVIRWTEDGADKVSDNAEEAWGNDGEITQFLEKVPVAGYVVSASHGIVAAIDNNRDSEQRARRAAASCTKSTLVTGAAIGGGIVAGPAGAMVGAAYGSVGGQCSEKGINHAIDRRFQTDGGTYHDFDAGRFIGEVVIDSALAGVSAGTTSTVGKCASRRAVGASLKQVGGGGVRRHVVKRAVEAAVEKPVTGACGSVMRKVYDPRKR